MRKELISSLRVIAAAALVLAACQDDRKQAVQQFVSFVEAAPYDVTRSTTSFVSLGLTVSDSALAGYNSLFAAFDPQDTSRQTLYEKLPGDFLLRLPISKVNAIAYSEAGDTLIARVSFERPEHEVFTNKLVALLTSYDSTTPWKEHQNNFAVGLRRIRSELQEPDTLTMWVLPGPRIARYETAVAVRDSVTRDSLARSAISHLSAVVVGARLTLRKFTDYSATGAPGLDGASIKGAVAPVNSEWFVDPRINISYIVECIGYRGADTLWESSYLFSTETVRRASVDFLCLWSGRGADAWTRLRPDFVDARLVARAGHDSVLGPWNLKR